MSIREFDPETDAWVGDPTRRTAVIIYVDYTCQICRHVRGEAQDLPDRVKEKGVFVHRHWPAAERAPVSEHSALAALAAHEQDAFEAMSERLYEADDLSDAGLRRIAGEIGLDVERFERDRASERLRQKLDLEMADRAAAPGYAAPSLFINGRHYDGPWDATAVLEAVEKPGAFKLRAAAEGFFAWAAAGGLVLVMATLAALLFVNLGFHHTYEEWRHTEFALSLGGASFGLSLEAWINDALMAIFFLLVGIEIKREILEGELSDPASAMLPLAAALGGMIAPALIYVAFNAGGPAAQGWGVPMATDIAFTIGLLALLGTRAPPALKIFVSALAVADDLGAIVVIALFYGHGFDVGSFIAAVVVFAAMIGLNVAKVYERVPYLLAGAALWFFVHESGLHATLAGVLTAAAIPSRPRGDVVAIAAQTNVLLKRAVAEGGVSAPTLNAIERAIDRLREPGYHVERRIQRMVNFGILPLFAFFNTGVLLSGAGFSPLAPESLGVILGLVIGKPLGVAGLSILAVRMGWARMPTGVNVAQLVGAGCLAGVGFTMSIFIATAAFAGPQLEAVKLSVLIASCLSAALGVALLWRAAEPEQEVEPVDARASA